MKIFTQLKNIFAQFKTTKGYGKDNEIVREIQLWSDKLSFQNYNDTIDSIKFQLNQLISKNINLETQLVGLAIIEKSLFLLEKKIKKRNIESDHSILALSLSDIIDVHISIKNILKNLANIESEKNIYPKDMMLNILHLKIYHCGRIIYLSYICHKESPENTWLHLHQIYFKAKRLGLHKKSIHDKIDPNLRLDTIQEIYTHYLIFSCADPLRFRAKTIIHLYYLTEQWTQLANLEIENKKNIKLYTVDTSLDQPPKLEKSTKLNINNKIYLNLAELCIHIDSLKTFITSGISREKITFSDIETSTSYYLLNKIQNTLIGENKRKTEREVCLKPTETCFGLTSICDHLGKSYNKSNMDSILTNKNSNVEVIILDDSSLPGQQDNATTPHITNYSTYLCEIVNYNAHGGCLICKSPIPSKLLNGEVVSIKYDDNIMIGVIRWLINKHDQASFGIEFVAQNPLVATAKKISNNTNITTPVLLFKDEIDGVEYLLNPHLPFNHNDTIEITTPTERVSIELGPSIALSASYKKNTYEYTLPNNHSIKNLKDNISNNNKFTNN